MADDTVTGFTIALLQQQWCNPRDIFTFLMIIGGDVVQVALAQLSGGPVPLVTPVCFSFGWVSYAVLSLLSLAGDKRLLPRSESSSLLINADSGYARSNHSWFLSRLLRDFDFWRHEECEVLKSREMADTVRLFDQKRLELTGQLNMAKDPGLQQRLAHRLDDLPHPSNLRVGLRVTVWHCKSTRSRGSGDAIYYAGLLVSLVQLTLAAIPWIVWGEWFTFLITAAGTSLAYASGALPQWKHEKILVGGPNPRRLRTSRRYLLTKGNGAGEAILILCEKGQTDLEALASSQRDDTNSFFTRAFSATLAILWIALLLTVSGWTQHTWYLVGVGFGGMIHNIVVAATPRRPEAGGFDLEYRETFVSRKVMQTLWKLEKRYPRAGLSLVPEFFPGDLQSREKRVWDHARARYQAWSEAGRPVLEDGAAIAWNFAPLQRPPEREDDWDVSPDGEYGLCDRV